MNIIIFEHAALMNLTGHHDSGHLMRLETPLQIIFKKYWSDTQFYLFLTRWRIGSTPIDHFYFFIFLEHVALYSKNCNDHSLKIMYLYSVIKNSVYILIRKDGKMMHQFWEFYLANCELKPSKFWFFILLSFEVKVLRILDMFVLSFFFWKKNWINKKGSTKDINKVNFVSQKRVLKAQSSYNLDVCNQMCECEV